MSATTLDAQDDDSEARGSARHWLDCRVAQQASYASETKRARVLAALSRAPAPLRPDSVAALGAALEGVARGEAFILQMGDCAEPIADANARAVGRKIAFLEETAGVLAAGLGKRVVRVGRIAGQYGKPRSQPIETRNEVTLPAFRGESINGYEFNAESRAANPLRLRSAFLAARKTHELIDAHNEAMAPGLHHDRIFTSHEALHLVFEDALSRDDDGIGRYNALGHLVWIGARTNDPDHAHVRYCAGLGNPIAVKVSPKTTPDEIQRIHRRLNPRNRPGRLAFISRMGAGQVAAHLPALVEALDAIGAAALWMCDPMHGNTFSAPSGVKTRAVADIRSDIADTVDVLAGAGHMLAGLHLETSPDDIAECVSAREGEREIASLGNRFLSKCDPRLNHPQTVGLCRWLVTKLTASTVTKR